MIFHESRRLEGYITNKLPNISRCISAHIHQLAMVYTYAMLNFDEVYIQRC